MVNRNFGDWNPVNKYKNVPQIMMHPIPPKKITWHWKITISSRIYTSSNCWVSIVMVVFRGVKQKKKMFNKHDISKRLQFEKYPQLSGVILFLFKGSWKKLSSKKIRHYSTIYISSIIIYFYYIRFYLSEISIFTRPIHISGQMNIFTRPIHISGQMNIFTRPIHISGQMNIFTRPVHISGQMK